MQTTGHSPRCVCEHAAPAPGCRPSAQSFSWPRDRCSRRGACSNAIDQSARCGPRVVKPRRQIVLARRRELLDAASPRRVQPRSSAIVGFAELGQQARASCGRQRPAQSARSSARASRQARRRSARARGPRHRARWRAACPQQRVALLQRALERAPDAQEIMFHVEHTPIEEAPAHLGGPEISSCEPGSKHDDGDLAQQIGDRRPASRRSALRARPLPRESPTPIAGTDVRARRSRRRCNRRRHAGPARPSARRETSAHAKAGRPLRAASSCRRRWRR